MVTDPIADLLTRIRNGLSSRKIYVETSKSNVKLNIATLLQEEGFLKSVEVVQNEGDSFETIRIFLKYSADAQPVIQSLKRVSRPGLRQYVGSQDVPQVISGYGISVVSTSQGIMTGQKAKRANIGGEVLCTVY